MVTDAATPSVIAEIQDFEAERQRALTALDITLLDRILADDLIHIHSTGMAHDKAQFIAHVTRMGGFRFIERGPLDIRIEGDMALVTGATQNGVRSPETGADVTLHGFSTLVLRRGASGWQIVLSQLTPFRDPPGKA